MENGFSVQTLPLFRAVGVGLQQAVRVRVPDHTDRDLASHTDGDPARLVDGRPFRITLKAKGWWRTRVFAAGRTGAARATTGDRPAARFATYRLFIPALDPVKKKISSDIFSDRKIELVVRFREATLETITLPACARFDKFAMKPSDYPAVIDALDKLATDVWAKYHVQ